MKDKLSEIWDELKSVLSGSTIDTLLPPIAFGVVYTRFELNAAVGASVGLALLLGALRLVRKQPWHIMP
jgi:hypothetical protein